MVLTAPMPDQMVTTAEAAAIAGVTEALIRQWATRGKISRFPGRTRRDRSMYARPELEAIAAQQAHAA